MLRRRKKRDKIPSAKHVFCILFVHVIFCRSSNSSLRATYVLSAGAFRRYDSDTLTQNRTLAADPAMEQIKMLFIFLPFFAAVCSAQRVLSTPFTRHTSGLGTVRRLLSGSREAVRKIIGRLRARELLPPSLSSMLPPGEVQTWGKRNERKKPEPLGKQGSGPLFAGYVMCGMKRQQRRTKVGGTSVQTRFRATCLRDIHCAGLCGRFQPLRQTPAQPSHAVSGSGDPRARETLPRKYADAARYLRL